MTTFCETCFVNSDSHILRALALGIGLPDEKHLLDFHCGHYNELRLLHYTPIPAETITSGRLARMPAQTDWSTLTILFQGDCGGMQVESPTVPGSFIDVPPSEGTCIMNVGNLMMRWSNGYLKSTMHPVQSPLRQNRFVGDESLIRERYWVPYV